MGQDITQLEQEQLDEIRTEIGFLSKEAHYMILCRLEKTLNFHYEDIQKKFGKIKDATPMVLEVLKNCGT